MEHGQAGLRKAAALVVEFYGEDAVQYAAQRVVVLREQGDLMGATGLAASVAGDPNHFARACAGQAVL